MGERDEFQDQPLAGDRRWRDRPPEEHGQALAGLMRYVSAAPRHQKKDALEFPVIKRLAPQLARKAD